MASCKKTVQRSERPYIALGTGLIALLIVVMGGWAAAATVASAVIGSGTIVVDGNQKAIQHLEGGIVAEIPVSEGASVKRGDLLLRLDDTLDRARVTEINARLADLVVRQARLEAEVAGLGEFEIPAESGRSGNPDALRSAYAAQSDLMEARRMSLDSQVSILRQQIAQFGAAAEGLQKQRNAMDRNVAILRGEFSNLQALYDQGHATKTRLLTLEREIETLIGEMGRISAEIARAEIRESETELNIAALAIRFREGASAELATVKSEIQALEQQRVAAENRLNRVALYAPRNGRILSMSTHTVGGVINAGEIVMRIVPEEDLVIEVQIRPHDIDRLAIGQIATVRFPAFSQRTTPQIEGALESISADRLVDEVTAQPYFLARIRVPQSQIDRLAGKKLIPGMPAEVFLQGGSRTVLSYLMKPLTEQVAHSFRER